MFTIIIVSCLALTTIGLPVGNNVNPELNGGGYQGDMLFPPKSASTRGAATIGENRRWPNKTIPYDLSAITNTNDQNTIMAAMNQLMYDVGTPVPGQPGRQVCVYFRPAQASDQEVLKAQYGNGCSASVGYYPNYEKSLNLQQDGCFHTGTIQHELTHVLGFFHEQSRPDRDSFITIHNENISPDMAFNFDKYEWQVDVENQGFGYDYGSIMHYPEYAFSANGAPTIVPHQQNVVIGQRDQLSATDIAEIRHYYKC